LPGFTHAIANAADLVTAVVPRSCLDNQAWVKVRILTTMPAIRGSLFNSEDDRSSYKPCAGRHTQRLFPG
jgi:hypothetical protein